MATSENVTIAGTTVPRVLAADKTVNLDAGTTASAVVSGHTGGRTLTLKGSGWSAATATTGLALGAAGSGTSTTSIVKVTGSDNWTADDFNGKQVRVSTYDTLALTESAAVVTLTANSPGQTLFSAAMVVGTTAGVAWNDRTKTLTVTVLAAGTSDDAVATAINISDAKGYLTAVSSTGGDFTSAIAEADLAGGAVSIRTIDDTTTTALAISAAVTGLAAGGYFEVVEPATTVTALAVRACQCPVVIADVALTAIDVDDCASITLQNCAIVAADVKDCDEVQLDNCGAASGATVVISDCRRVELEDCALDLATLRTLGCAIVEGDSAGDPPTVDKLTAAVAAAGGDLVITGRELIGGMAFDTLVVTLGDSAGTLTVTARKPGVSGYTFEILAPDTGTSLGVTYTSGAVVVQLTETTGDSAAEIATVINANAANTDGYVRAIATGSGDTTSAVAEAALAGGVGSLTDTKVLIGGVEALPANETAGAATWADTEITATMGADHAQNEIVGVTVEIDGELSNQLSFVVA